jgi:hypothetical protein
MQWAKDKGQKIKDKRKKTDIENNRHKTNYQTTRTPLKTEVLRKGYVIILHM